MDDDSHCEQEALLAILWIFVTLNATDIPHIRQNIPIIHRNSNIIIFVEWNLFPSERASDVIKNECFRPQFFDL